MIVFEYPLTEKSRNYLRFEMLFTQINQSMQFNCASDIQAYFKSLFELIELSDRSDIRLELVKDLRELAGQMQTWLQRDDVDIQAIEELVVECKELTSALVVMPKQIKFFKNSRFLTSLKQRFFIPGGCCNFDLPQFYYWQAQPIEVKQQEAQRWFAHFNTLERSLALFLKIKRHQGCNSIQQAKNGFFQGEVEQALFVTVKLDIEQHVYPMISGHKNRYSIRFMNADMENSHAGTTEFEQILC